MKNLLPGLVIFAALAAACGFENTSELLTPTAPSPGATTGGGTPSGASGSSNGSANGSSGGSPTATPASAFAGAWATSSFAGLPLDNCADMKWLITEQSPTSVGGTVSATCQGGTTVSANLTGELKSDSVIDLTAKGTFVAMGLPCAFDLKGTGTRQAGDSMKVDYSGTYCFGSVSGTEQLRRFPTTP